MTVDTTAEPHRFLLGPQASPHCPRVLQQGLALRGYLVVSSSRHRKTEVYTQARRNSNPTRSECLQLPSMLAHKCRQPPLPFGQMSAKEKAMFNQGHLVKLHVESS